MTQSLRLSRLLGPAQLQQLTAQLETMKTQVCKADESSNARQESTTQLGAHAYKPWFKV